MGLLKGLLQIIRQVAPPTLPEARAQLLARLDPEKFYVENVRSILGVSHASAVRICETAVRQGLFERRVEIKCPDGAVAASADSETGLPQTVRCWVAEGGVLEPVELPTKELEKSIFYRLNDSPDSLSYRQTA